MLRVRAAPVVAAVVVVAVSGCTGAPAVLGPEVRVAASFYPLAEAARRVGGGRVRVTDLTPAGAEPHDLELTTTNLDLVIDADALFYLGGGFQPALDEAVAKAKGRVVDLLDGMPTLAGATDDDHGGSAADPHVWLDPQLMRRTVERIAGVLTSIDASGADGYASRARELDTELQTVDDEYRSTLATCMRNLVVTSHASFAYLAARYGLEQHSIAGVSPEAEPDPRRLAELAALVRTRGVTTIFTETLVSAKVAETLAREAGVSTAVLDPIEGLTREQSEAGESYVSLMRKNLAALEGALRCT